MRYAVNFFTNLLLPEIKIEWLFGNPSPSSELSTLQNQAESEILSLFQIEKNM